MSDKILEVACSNPEFKKQLTGNIRKYDQLSLADQAALGKQLVVSDAQKTRGMEVMRDVTRNMEIEINAYQQKLGRKLTDEELSNYLSGQKLSTVVDGVDQNILKRIENMISGQAQTQQLIRH